MAMDRAFVAMRANTPNRGQALPVHRTALEELRDYPFFAPEGDLPARPWLARYGLSLLLALLAVLAVELALLLLIG